MGKALLLAVNIFCGLYGAYFAGVIVLGALRRQKPPYPAAAPTNQPAAAPVLFVTTVGLFSPKRLRKNGSSARLFIRRQPVEVAYCTSIEKGQPPGE